MKIINFKLERRVLFMGDPEPLYGSLVIQEVSEREVDYEIPKALENYIYQYFEESWNYGEKYAEEILKEDFILIGYIGLRGWILKSKGRLPFHIYFDKEKFNIYSEKEPVALDGYIDYQLTGVQQALEDISKYFEKYVDELMTQLW